MSNSSHAERRRTRAWAVGVAVGIASASLGSSVLAAEHIVRIVSDYENVRMIFEPKHLKVEPGDTVTWVNEAAEEHNVIAYPDGYPKGAAKMNSPIMEKAAETWSYTFTVEGTYEYHCMPHLPMGMRGTVEVGRPSANDEINIPTAEETLAYRELLMTWFDQDELADVSKR